MGGDNVTNKEIEDYINNYRLYPDEYTGRRDNSILKSLSSSYRFNPKDNTITRLEGHINDSGDFEIVGLFKFPIDKPEDKTLATTFDRDYKFTIQTFNGLMVRFGREDSIIAEDKDTKNWTLRDMVSEIENIRSTYYDPNHVNNRLKKSDPITFNNDTNCLRGFLRKYRDQIDGITAYTTHNSKYD